MIVKCGKILIDTMLDHEAHKKAIGSAFISCAKDAPRYVFVQHIYGETRFYHLDYNKDGSKLLKIEYWEKLKQHEKPKKLEKRLKASKNKEMCYFTKNKIFEEDEYEMVEVTDYDKNYISKNETTVWDHMWNDNLVQMPEHINPKKSRWRFWS